MNHVGLDAHQRLYVMCMLDQNGKVLRQWKVRGSWQMLMDDLKELQEPFAICLEASCGAAHLADQLRKVAKRVVVAHPGQLRLIFKSKRKNDRVDARKLAMLLFLEQVPVVHVPDINVRTWRECIEFRHRLVSRRTQSKNALRSLLRNHGIESPPRHRLWTQRGRAWLAEVQLPTLQAQLQRDLLLDEVTQCDQKIKRVETELARLAADSPAVAVLRTIPGVGIRTAEAVAAYIDDPHRFRHSKTIGSYFGVVPCQNESAGKARFGHITRDGPRTVRKLLTEASWQGIRRSPKIRAYYERLRRCDPKRKKIALIATAHYLSRVMLALLRTGEAWQESPAQAA